MLGHGYGRKFSNPTNNRIYRIRSGQALWEELTGDPDFYLKIISLMSNAALEHRTQFEAEWIRALKRFEDEFLINFGNPDNSINWEKLLRSRERQVCRVFRRLRVWNCKGMKGRE